MRTVHGLISAAACVAWGLTLTGCMQSHAQRPASQWKAVRVLADADPDRRYARVELADREDFYTLVREVRHGSPWNGRELGEYFLKRGERLGFARTDDNGVIAIAGDQQLAIEPGPGVTFVWYREKAPFGFMPHPSHQTFWLTLGVAALVALVVVLVSEGDGSLEVNF